MKNICGKYSIQDESKIFSSVMFLRSIKTYSAQIMRTKGKALFLIKIS